MSKLCEQLKLDAPNQFEKFRTEYLRENFPYWNEDKEKVKIYFCEMDFRMQIYFFLDYFTKIGLATTAELLADMMINRLEYVEQYIYEIFMKRES